MKHPILGVSFISRKEEKKLLGTKKNGVVSYASLEAERLLEEAEQAFVKGRLAEAIFFLKVVRWGAFYQEVVLPLRFEEVERRVYALK